MKKYTWILGAVIIFSAVAFAGTARQQEKEYTVKMTYSEWQVVYSIIDDAAVDGKTRKHLLGKIGEQVNSQAKDTTKPKR